MRRVGLLAYVLAPALALAMAHVVIPTGSPSSRLTAFSLNGGGAAFEAAGSICHVSFSGVAIQDSQGCTWSMTGTVPQQPTSFVYLKGVEAPSAGPFTSTQRYALAAGGPVHPAGDFSVSVRFSPSSAAAGVLVSQGALVVGVNTDRTVYATVGGVTVTSASLAAVGGHNVVTVTRTGTTVSLRLNADGSPATVGGAATTAGSGTVLLGTNGTLGFGGLLYEVAWYPAPPPEPPSYYVGGGGVASERSSEIYVDGVTYAPGVPVVTPSMGILVTSATTNLFAWSERMDVPNVSGGWGLPSGTWYSVDTGTLPGRGAVLDTFVNASNPSAGAIPNAGAYGGTTGGVTTVSGWMGSADVIPRREGLLCYSSNYALGIVACHRDDGVACAYGVNGYGWQELQMDFPVAPTRAAISYNVPGGHGGMNCPFSARETLPASGMFGAVQLERSAFATPYVPTTAVPVSRAAERVTTPNPIPNGSAWCLRASYRPFFREWTPGGTQTLWSMGTTGAASTADLSVVGNNLVFSVVGGDGLTRTITHDVSDLSVEEHHHEITACVSAGGGLSLYHDGISIGTPSGSGTGIITVQPTPIIIGARDAPGSEFNGWVKDFFSCVDLSHCR